MIAPKLHAFRKIVPVYVAGLGFPNYLAFGLERLRSGSRLEHIADELRPLFAGLDWDQYPSREVVGSVLRRWKTPAGEPSAPDQIAAARHTRAVLKQIANLAAKAAASSASLSTTATPQRVEACAAAFLAGSRRRADAAQVVYPAVTFENQVIFTARFTADGRTIVFDAARQANVPAVYVIRPDYPGARPLGLEDTHLLAASSHGELAVLTRARYIGHRVFIGTLARVPLEGGTPRDMLDSVRDADWSPDGSALAIIRVVGGRDRLEYPVGTVLYDAPGYLSDLRISPDGERVAFMEHPARYDDRGAVDVVDRTRRRTVIALGFSGEQGVAWSLDGRLRRGPGGFAIVRRRGGRSSIARGNWTIVRSALTFVRLWRRQLRSDQRPYAPQAHPSESFPIADFTVMSRR